MVIEFANLGLFIAVGLCFLQIIYNLASLIKKYSIIINFNFIIFLILLFDFIVLLYSFYISDFSVALIAQNSSSLKEPIYRLASLWASYQGSLFLWLFFISGFASYAGFCNKVEAKENLIATLIINCLMAIMIIFIAFFANPFSRSFPVVVQGQDLNPLLEDLSLVIHPPLLYLGYAALGISCCYALAILLVQKYNDTLINNIYFYNKIAWIFLFFSMLSGSYWAYYELGWGGYWSFDPVENYALMPWLASLGVLHFNYKLPKKAIFFAVLAFSLAVLGSFFARTNFVFSVHSFMGSFTQNITIFLFIFCILFPSWFIFIKNYSYLSKTNKSKKSLLYYFYILLVMLISSLLMAELIPLFYNLVTSDNIYINNQYYYYSFVPLAIIVIFLMLYATITKGYITSKIIYMLFAHFGILYLVISICLSSLYSTSNSISFLPKQKIIIHGISLQYLAKHNFNAKNYYSTKYEFLAIKDDKKKNLTIEQRDYLIQNQQIIKVGLANFGLSQIYLIPQNEMNNKLLIKLDYNYNILGIWLGGALSIFGTLLKFWSKKLNKRRFYVK